jgi:hypothetical protein
MTPLIIIITTTIIEQRDRQGAGTMRSRSSRGSCRSSRGLLLRVVAVVLALLVAGVAGESADLYAVQCAKVRQMLSVGRSVARSGQGGLRGEDGLSNPSHSS